MSCAPFCTMEKSEGRYKDNSALTFHLDRGILLHKHCYLIMEIIILLGQHPVLQAFTTESCMRFY